MPASTKVYDYGFDNRFPNDKRYPVFRPAASAYNPRHRKDGSSINVIVEVGDYLIDRTGHIMIATTSNAGPYPNDFLRDISEGFIRARYLGNTDDGGVCANQIRKASAREVAIAEKYHPVLQLPLL